MPSRYAWICIGCSVLLCTSACGSKKKPAPDGGTTGSNGNEGGYYTPLPGQHTGGAAGNAASGGGDER